MDSDRLTRVDPRFDWAQAFERERRHLFGVAYRMTGSAALADDVVQDAWLRVAVTDEVPRSARAYLTTVVTRLALDAMTSARARRESYVGPWLPEPVLGDHWEPELGPDDKLDRGDAVSLALLSVLESLSPIERAVFLLREAFDYEYDEIATVLGKTEVACRQLFHRARARVEEDRTRFFPPPDEVERLLVAFVTAAGTGDAASLVTLLAEDVVAVSDGGGVVRAARKVVRGRDDVARFVLGVARKGGEGVSATLVTLNGAPAVLFRAGDRLIQASWIECRDGRITRVAALLNPDKLASLAFAGAPRV